MNSILEQAQNDLAFAKRDAFKAQVAYRAAIAKLKAAQLRVDKLLITQMEIDHEQDVIRQRAARKAGGA